MKHFKYLKYVLAHKWYVFKAGLKTGAPLWRLIIHDWTKFLPSEWMPYAEYFYGYNEEDRVRFRRIEEGVFGYHVTKSAEQVKQEFNKAWLLHQRRNKHHWQWWLLVNDNPDERHNDAYVYRRLDYRNALEMPEKYVREMLADWFGAGRAITGKWEAKEWYANNAANIIIHPKTRESIEKLLDTTTITD